MLLCCYAVIQVIRGGADLQFIINIKLKQPA